MIWQIFDVCYQLIWIFFGLLNWVLIDLIFRFVCSKNQNICFGIVYVYICSINIYICSLIWVLSFIHRFEDMIVFFLIFLLCTRNDFWWENVFNWIILRFERIVFFKLKDFLYLFSLSSFLLQLTLMCVFQFLRNSMIRFALKFSKFHNV